MSAVENVKNIAQSKIYSLPVAQAYLMGRIKARRKVPTKDGALIFTTLNLPAVDEYSNPETVEVQSREQIGAPGDDWSGYVRLGGFANNYDSKPDKDGEIKKVQAARNHLVVIES